MPGRQASAPLYTRIRNLNTELVALEQALRSHGDRESAEAVRRSRREIDVVVRQGLYQARQVNL